MLSYIHSGQLRAVNTASPTAKRNRWKLRPSDCEAFEKTRENRTQQGTKPKPRRRPSTKKKWF